MNIHFRITNHCNLHCRGCWGPDRKITAHMKPDMVIKALQYLAPIENHDKINITGGEPTMNPYFADIIDILLQVPAFKTISTNLYDCKAQHIEHMLKLDRIQLPLDGSDDLRFSKFRCNTNNYLPKVTHFIYLLKNLNYNGITKFGTVIVDDDLSDIRNIYKIIRSFCLEKMEWRIYPLFKKNGQYIYIRMDKMLMKVKNECEENGIHFSLFTPFNRSDKYIFVNPNGSLSTIKNNVEITIGQL